MAREKLQEMTNHHRPQPSTASEPMAVCLLYVVYRCVGRVGVVILFNDDDDDNNCDDSNRCETNHVYNSVNNMRKFMFEQLLCK